MFAYCRTGNRTGVLLTRLVNHGLSLASLAAPVSTHVIGYGNSRCDGGQHRRSSEHPKSPGQIEVLTMGREVMGA